MHGSSTTKSTVASVLIGIQAGMAALVGVVLLSVNAGRRRRFARRFFHEQFAHRFGLWGVVFFAVAASLVVVALGVAERRPWAPVTVYIVEAVLGVASLLRFHPMRSLLGLTLALAAVILVASDTAQLPPPDGETAARPPRAER